MGAGSSSRHAQLSLTDPKVCRSFLVGTCPHDLFTNTKQDLGPCPKVHSEPLKTEYEAMADKSKLGFDYDYMRDMQKYIDDCNRRIDTAQRRLEKTPDEIRQTNALVSATRIQIRRTLEVLTSPLCKPAQTDLGPLAHHQHRPARNRHPRRILLRQHRLHRVLQDPHLQSRQRGEGARTPLLVRHVGSFRAPEASGLRCMRCVFESTGQRSQTGGSFLRENALGVCADAEDVGRAAAGVEGPTAAGEGGGRWWWERGRWGRVGWRRKRLWREGRV